MFRDIYCKQWRVNISGVAALEPKKKDRKEKLTTVSKLNKLAEESRI